MDTPSLNIGIMHSLVGENDGVSIVIDQTVKALVDHMEVPLGNIFFLAGHAPSRFNTTLNEVFWHKNDVNRNAVKYFSEKPPKGLVDDLEMDISLAEEVIGRFVSDHDIDLLIAHNVSHPYNFVGAVGLGRYLEKRRQKSIIVPRCLVWWHDSHYEREQFASPGRTIAPYMKYLPGTSVDGIIFINSSQPPFARAYMEKYGRHDLDLFFEKKTEVIPNTCAIGWDWQDADCPDDHPIFPPQARYNRSFFKEVGLIDAVEEKGFDLKETLILLQHTRIVPRKRIDVAIDFAFRIASKLRKEGAHKCVALLVSGHSGDEHGEHRRQLDEHYRQMARECPEENVVLVFGEHVIFPHREIIVDRKFYDFSEVPSIVAARGGLGTYFSEIEGFGNNLLEMMAAGLPVVINRYKVFESDIDKYGFQLPSTSNCELNDRLIDECHHLLTDFAYQNRCVRHNLHVLEERLNHKVMAGMLEPVINNLFTYA